jgi:hypothetical protein
LVPFFFFSNPVDSGASPVIFSAVSTELDPQTEQFWERKRSSHGGALLVLALAPFNLARNSEILASSNIPSSAVGLAQRVLRRERERERERERCLGKSREELASDLSL